MRTVYRAQKYGLYRSTWAVSKPNIQSQRSSQLENSAQHLNPASNLKFTSESNTSSQTETQT